MLFSGWSYRSATSECTERTVDLNSDASVKITAINIRVGLDIYRKSIDVF